MDDLSASPQIEFRTEPQRDIPAYWVNYLNLLPTLNKDRKQTLSLEGRGLEEINPMLGKRPSKKAINAYFALRAAVLSPAYMATMDAPDWVKSSVADSARVMGEMVTDQNEALFKGEARPRGLPLALVLSSRFDWDRPIEKGYRKMMQTKKREAK